MNCVVCGNPYTLPHFCSARATALPMSPFPHRHDVLLGRLDAAARHWTGPYGELLAQAADAIRELRGAK